MKESNSRRILLVAVALLGAIGLVAISAVATVFAYRQFAGEEELRASLDFDRLEYGQDEQGRGVPILSVEPGSPAEQAGLTSGAVILSVNGQEVNSPQELKDAIRDYEVGDTITLTVEDGSDTRDVTVTLADSGPYLGVNVGPSGGFFHRHGEGFENMPHGYGMPGFPRLPGQPGSPEGMRPFGFPFDEFDMEPFGNHGRFFDLLGNSALVMTVVEDGPATAAGLEAGDAIVEANGQAIEDSQQLIDLISELSPGDELALEVQRGSESVSLDVTLASHPDDEGRAYLGVFLAPGNMHREFEFFEDRQNS